MRPQLTIEAFAEFCERKPADEKYEVMDTGECALAQFARSIGFVASTYDFCLVDHAGRQAAIPGLKIRDTFRGECTFGSLARRLRNASVSP